MELLIQLTVLLVAGAAAFYNLKGDVRVLRNDVEWLKKRMGEEGD